MAASLGWDGPGRGSAELTYFIDTVPSSVKLSQTEVESAIESALEAWSDVIDVDFTATSQPHQRDSLDFTFKSIDGAGRTVAQAYFPDDVNSARVAGDVEFDTSENWEVGNALGRAAFDLVQVAAHEIGHALGLNHNANSGGVLSPFVSPTQRFSGLSSADIDAALRLYAAAPVEVAFEAPLDLPLVSDVDANGSLANSPEVGTTPSDPGDSSGTPSDSGAVDDSPTETNDDDPGTNNDDSGLGNRWQRRVWRVFWRWSGWFRFTGR